MCSLVLELKILVCLKIAALGDTEHHSMQLNQEEIFGAELFDAITCCKDENRCLNASSAPAFTKTSVC